MILVFSPKFMAHCNNFLDPPLCDSAIGWSLSWFYPGWWERNQGCVSTNSRRLGQIKVLDVRDDGQRRWKGTKDMHIVHWAWMIQSTSCCAMNTVRTENSYLGGGVKSPFDFRWWWRRAEGGFDWIGLARNQALRWLTEAAGETWSPCTDIDTNSSSSSLSTSLSSSLAPSLYLLSTSPPVCLFRSIRGNYFQQL